MSQDVMLSLKNIILTEGVREFLQERGRKRFLKNPKARAAIYDKIKSLLSDSMSINKVVDKLLQRRSPDDYSPTACFLRHVNEELKNGRAFYETIIGWAESGEIMLIKASNEGGKLEEGFEKSVMLLKKLILMKSTVKKELFYPILLIIALCGLLFGFSNYMVPILINFSDPSTWQPSAQLLYSFSTFLTGNLPFILIAIFVLISLITRSLPKLQGRVRNILDHVFPFNLYKDIQSGLFLISMATLMKANITFRKSLDNLKNESSPYVQGQIEEIIDNVDSGMNNGDALNTKFVGDIGKDIADYASGSNIEDAMEKLADTAIDEKIEKITKGSATVRGIVILVIVLFVMWAYLSFTSITMGIDTGTNDF